MGSSWPTPLEVKNEREGTPLISGEKKLELKQVAIQEIQMIGKFILAKMARIVQKKNNGLPFSCRNFILSHKLERRKLTILFFLFYVAN